MTGHLRHGGALLLYPSGIIEDDPMVPSELPHTPAVWSDLTGMLAVLGGPGVVVCTILVGRVSSAAAVANRWVRRGKTADVRSKRASLLSLLLRMTRSQYVEIRSGAPVTIGVLPDERKRRAYYGGVTAVIRSRLNALANFCKN